jgi:hypothetical protein
MAHFPKHSPAKSPVVLLGDHDTVRAHRDDLSENAAQQGCVIADTFSFAPGEAASTDDLAELGAVVSALGRALADRLHIWVPLAGPDLGREQHWRRLSLVLQRHGLNLLVGREREPCPVAGGYSEIDFALRREVQAVDDLDNAALAAVGAESLGREIELELAAAGASASCAPPAVRRISASVGAEADARLENVLPPMLPAPTAPWGSAGRC